MAMLSPRAFPFAASRKNLIAALAAGALVSGAGAARAQFFDRPAANVPSQGADAPSQDARQDTSALLRVDRLESQVRDLNGQIEQLQFQIKRLEDALRKFQSDADSHVDQPSDRAALLLACLAMSPAIAAEPPASEASVRALLAVTQSEKLLDSTLGQIDTMMQRSMMQALAGQKLTAEQQKIMDKMRTKTIALFKEDMKWQTLEPMFIDIYKQSFTQKEIDGMLDFYRSEPGQAVIAKMPVVMQNTMQVMQERMAVMMPKMLKLQQDAIAELKASRTK